MTNASNAANADALEVARGGAPKLKVGDMVMVRIVSTMAHQRTVRFEPRKVWKVTKAGWVYVRHEKFKGDTFPMPEQYQRAATTRSHIERVATPADIEEYEARRRAAAHANKPDPDEELRERAREMLRALSGYQGSIREDDVQVALDAMKWAQTR